MTEVGFGIGSIKSKALNDAKEIAELKVQIEKQLETLNSEIADAQANVKDLRSISDFQMTVISAQTDDREAYDILSGWAEDGKFKFANEARKAWREVYKAHCSSFYQSGLEFPWAENIKHREMNIDELTKAYETIRDIFKPAYIEYISKRTDIPKSDRLNFFIRVMNTDCSLTAVEYAGRYFSQEVLKRTGINYKPMEIGLFNDWWDENRDNLLSE